MATQGILLPVELLIKNLLDITKLLKLFASSNILAESFGGKKIDGELNKILQRLESVLAKAQSAFTTLSNFSSVEKDVALIELGLNRINQDIANLSFKDLKIPDDVQGQIEALLGRINELNNSLLTFKGTQKAKLVSNLEFMANLKVAEPAQAAKMLEKGYDELFQAINKGMGKVNTELALKAAAFKLQQEVITLNKAGKAAMTQWGALGFILEAFKALPRDDSKKSETQKLMDSIMNYTAGDNKTGGEFASFKRGAIGLNSFLKAILSRFEFSPLEMNEIRLRLSELAKELSKTAQTSVTDVLKRMGTDENLAKNILFGSKADIVSNLKEGYKEQQAALEKLRAELDNYTTRLKAYENVLNAFKGPNNDIAAKAKEVAQALLEPTKALENYQLALLLSVINNPALAASFGSATNLIRTMVSTIDSGRAKLAEMDLTINKMLGVSNFINRYIGVYAIVRKVSLAISNAMNNIKELDLSITNIAVVTNMSLEDLWGKIGEYTAMAQEYGVATKDVYTVSQLFYQQGLLTSQVMSLTTETLKMAKIAGMGYEEAANAMTVAVRAFRIEMQDALQVTDTYSALAAKFAVSSAEIANAMEKTASSAANVGMSLQSTSAFMSVMIQTTRESAQNIGSALKSIISRYGEMKASPSTLLNVDGEEVAFNKVDTALKSVGISIKDASGQFRDFDDVILELALKWNSLDNNTQRYIATIMAGNRQQSRFIALVSNYDELSRAMDVANTSENASIVQVGKTMDSLETKTNKLKNAFSLLYLDLHLEEGLKGAYDWLTRIVTTIGKLGMLKGVLPTLATAINAGFGAKSLISMGIDNYKRKRFDLLLEVDANTSKALNKIEELVKQIETPREMSVNAHVNSSELDSALIKVATIELKSNIANTFSLMKQANPELTSSQIYSKLSPELLHPLNFTDVNWRKDFLKGLDITPENTKNYNNIDGALAKLGGAADAAAGQVLGAGETVSSTAQEVAAALQAESSTTEANTSAKEQEALASESVTQAKTNEVTSSELAAQADNIEAAASQVAALADNAEAAASLNTATSGLSIGAIASLLSLLSGSRIGELTYNAILPGLLASGEVASATQAKKWLAANGLPTDNNTAKQLRELTMLLREGKLPSLSALPQLPPVNSPKPIQQGESSQEKSHWYSKFVSKNKETGKTEFSSAGITTLSLTTGIARMIAPIITAAGASIKDKSNDRREYSKIVTGLGNGLSGAATGALIGMAAGPWGALVGAIGGFVLTGASAIFDGFNYDITERIANLRQEAKEASDESLKKLAKVIDLSSTLDNLKNLKNLMYNSSEDMKNYQDAVASAADSYPELISSYDDAGNAIIDLTSAETTLSLARLEGARAAKTAALKELETSDKEMELFGLQSNRPESAYTTLDTYVQLLNEQPTREEFELLMEKNPSRYKQFYYPDIFDRTTGEFDLASFRLHGIAPRLLSKLNEWVKKNSDTIGKKDIYTLAGVNETTQPFSTWGITEIERATTAISSAIERAQEKNRLLRTSADLAISLEEFITKINNDTSLSQELTSLLEATKNYLGLFTNTLLKRNTKYNDLKQWLDAEDSNFESVSAEVYSLFLDWYNGLSDGFKKAFAQVNFTEYKSADEIISKFNIEDTGLQNGLIELFSKANQANRDRILKTIYSDEGNGWDLNSELEGLNKFTTEIEGYGLYNKALDIAYKFKDSGNGSTIISKYADYFTNQLVSIDKLADDGYEALARSRLDTLSSLADALSQIKNSNIQNDLFKTITSIDLSSFSSITDAYNYILQYGEENNKTAEVAGILGKLKEAEQNLIYNVNTLAQELTTTVTNAAKDIDSLLTTNKSGLTFDKAIKSFNKISAAYDDITNFDLIFTFDTALGKYVYTADGFEKALAQKEKDLYLQSTKLKEAAKVYTEQITSRNKFGEVQLKLNFDFLLDTVKAEKEETSVFKDNNSLMQALRKGNIINDQTTPEILNAYETLVHGYISQTEFINRSQESFEQYIKDYAQNVLNDANAAEILLENFKLNKKNLLYGAIDWSKLALGTDFSDTNKMLAENLAEEIGLLERTKDAEGNIIKTWHTENGKEATIEELQDEYLNQLYAGLENAELLIAMAKARLAKDTNNSKVNMASTAISELLSGGVKALSEESIALLTSYGQHIFKVDEQNNITSELDTNLDSIQLALDTYWKTTFNSIDEANNQYVLIIEASFAKANAGKSLLSNGNKLDFNTIGTALKSVGLHLDDVYKQNEKTGLYEWQNGFENALTTDIFGQTTITNWDNFVATLKEKGIEIGNESSAEYLKWYRAYIDAKISEAESIDPKKIAATLISNLGNAKVGDTLDITNIKDILGLSVDEIYISTLEQLDGYIKLFELQLLDTEWVTNNSLAAELARSIVSKFKTKDNKFEGLKGVIAELVSRSAAEAYASAMGYTGDVTTYMLEQLDYYWDDYSKLFKAGSDSIERIQSKIDELVNDVDAKGNKIDHSEEIAILTGMLKDLKDLTGNKAINVLRDILTNYTNVTNTMVETFEALFTNIDLDQFITEVNGKKELDIAALRQAYPEIAKLIDTSMQEEIAAIIDDNLVEIENATNLIASGTTSLKDMAAFVTKYNNDMKTNLSLSDLFSYDDILDSFTLKPEYLLAYILKLKEELEKLGWKPADIDKFIKDTTVKQLASAIDIDNFLDASDRSEGSKSREKLIKQFENLRKSLIDTSNLPDYAKKSALDSARLYAVTIVDAVEAGGEGAVNAGKELATLLEKELSPEEIEKYYYSAINRLQGYADSIGNLTKGSYVADEDLRAILNTAGMIDAETGLVTNVENMADAYYEIYKLMSHSAGKTAASLNKIYAQYLTASELGDIDAIAAMGDAMGMTYDALGTLLGKYGEELETWLRQNTGLYEKIGAGKIRITNFSQFASDMGWQPGSEEYTSAFKAYNDSLIELNNKTEKSIFDEIKNISDANIGDLINLTQAYTAIEKFEKHDMQDFISSLRDLGAEFSDGILTLSDNANIPMIIKAIAEEAQRAGGLIPELLASLNDVLIETLSKIANLIKSGINGTLSNVDAHNLSGWAKNVGIDKLDFVKTADGLKLALNSAIELYTKLNLIDSLQGKLVFDELNKSLQESNEHYKSISDIANRIAWIEDETHPERAQLYAQELALAKEILAVRSTTEDSSFNFMSNKIPGAQNNPINYFENWASAIHTFNEALKKPGTYTKDKKTYKSGFVDYDFWYNLVTEMNNIAGMGQDIEFAGVTLDGSLERASELILKGADSLVVTSTGEVKVALKGMALDFSSGTKAFSGDVTAGIQAMAKSLVEMLDGMILLLETVVAMEKLGDITGGDNTIDLTDLFPEFTSDTDKNTLKDIAGLNDFIEAAGDNLDTIIINGEKLSDTIKRALTEGLNKAEAENFTAIMNSLYLMYQSGEYNLDNIYDSIQEIMAASDFSGTIQLGDNTLIIQKGTTILLTKDGKYQANGKTYDTLNEAIATATVNRQGGGGEATWDDTTNKAKKTIHIKSLGIDVVIESGADGEVSFNDGYFNNLDEYILYYIDKNSSLTQEEKILKKIDVGLELGTVKLDSFTYNSINNTIKKQLEEALASGQQAQVDAVIEAHPVLSQLKGQTGEEISKLLGLNSVKTTVDNSLALDAIDAVEKALDNLEDKTITITTIEKTISDNTSSDDRTSNTSLSKPRVKKSFVYNSTGNIGLAQAKGTLMGELGPELVVSNGRYFVAGQSGPEMVNLADDAIVFNHLQTKSLLEKGTSPGRGKAITNERNAVAFATGNINGGPAMASASAALAALKLLRAQWDALAGLSVKDLAGKGGSGGGGGGNTDKIGNFVKELEKWYNWLQEIAELEEQINYQEKLRSKIQSDMIPHGQDIATSYMTSLDALEKEIAVQEDLRNAQQEYFDQRRAWMNSNLNPFSSLYTFDENGQLKYANGKLEELSNMVGRNEEGKANYDAKEQYEMIQAMGYGDFLKYDSSGKEIEFYLKDEKGNYKLDDKGLKIVNADAYTTAVLAFWDKIDADKEEMQSLHDSINEHRDAVLEKQLAMNEILKSIEDNLIAVENKVLDAMIDSREREIEESEKERDAIEKSSLSLIKGLSDQLNKERAMYEQLLDKNELNSLQRRLGILQRSGGSASEIASLQEQISLKQLDAYFDAQLNLIDALQEASDNELARLDALIELAKETLEYEKMHGLLWQKVSDVLAKSPADIATYIQQNNSKYWGQSRTQLAQTIREDLMEAMEFKKIQENFDVIAAYYKAFDDAANAGAKGKWTQDELGRWQYQKANGDLAKDSWEKVDDKWYRFDENGYMLTGWVKDQDQWYHLGESGAMDTSWFHDKDDKWYYLDETSGAMLSNTTKLLMWNGEKANHSFDETGAWTGSTPIEATEETKEKDLDKENSSNENKKYKVTYKITGTSGDLSPNNTIGYGIGDTEEEARNNALYYAKKKASGIANAKITYSDPVEYGSGALTDSTSTDNKEENNSKKEDSNLERETKYEVYQKEDGTWGYRESYKGTLTAAEARAEINKRNNGRGGSKWLNLLSCDTGGMVDNDQLALVHAKEGVLTAEQTSILRNEILGNRNDSLLSLLTDFREAWSETKNAYSSITRDSSVVIEHAEVNMNVESIDNDYGAQRAGEQALNQMMQIARKTQALNRVS